MAPRSPKAVITVLLWSANLKKLHIHALKGVLKYRQHKAYGQAIVTIDDRDFCLVAWNSTASRAEHDRIGDYFAAGRQLPPRGWEQ